MTATDAVLKAAQHIVHHAIFGLDGWTITTDQFKSLRASLLDNLALPPVASWQDDASLPRRAVLCEGDLPALVHRFLDDGHRAMCEHFHPEHRGLVEALDLRQFRLLPPGEDSEGDQQDALSELRKLLDAFDNQRLYDEFHRRHTMIKLLCTPGTTCEDSEGESDD